MLFECYCNFTVFMCFLYITDERAGKFYQYAWKIRTNIKAQGEGCDVLEIHCLVDRWIIPKARLLGHVGVHLTQVPAESAQLTT